MVRREAGARAHIPKLTHHKKSGRAVVRLNGKDFYCGPWRSVKAQAKYDRLIKRWLQLGRQLQRRRSRVLVSELILAYLKHAEGYYVAADGTPTAEYDRIRRELRPLRKLHGREAAVRFRGLELAALRDSLVKGELGNNWSRTSINHALGTIRRMFKWAVGLNLIPISAYARLKMVPDLARGRSTAREPKKVGPVAEEFVTAAEQYLSSTIRAMIRLQQLSGARPGEICALRGQDLEISTDRVWIARPTLHKLTHKGIVREIFFGPQAIAILKPLLKPDLTEPIFSPAAAERQRRQMQRLKRTTPLWPSHAQRYQHQHRRRPKRSPGMQYTPASYRTAIARACERAFPPPAPLDRQKGESSRAWRLRLTLEQRKQLRSWRCRHRFQPNQLRHSFATQVRRDYGLDVSQILLGHSSVTTTETYAMPDQDRAREVIAKIG